MEPELIGGNWIQTNAYILQSIKELIDKIVESGQTITVNPTPVDVVVYPTPVTVQSPDVILEQTIVLPRETQFVYNPLPIITPTNKPLTVVRNYIKPTPLVIDVDKMNAYQRVCGPYHPINDGYHYCMNCVDAWLAARPDGFEIKDLTRSGTGCTTKRPKRCCKPNGMSF